MYSKKGTHILYIVSNKKNQVFDSNAKNVLLLVAYSKLDFKKWRARSEEEK